MKGKMFLLAGVMALSLGLVGAPSSWANSLTYQGVTFNMTESGGNLLLNITGATSATGDWAGITYLDAFQISNYGDATGLSATGAGGWTAPTAGGLNANGCDGSGTGVCFTSLQTPGFTLTNDFTITIAKSSGSWNLNLPDNEGGFGPHLKVRFLDATGEKQGSLLSQTVPVPGTALMFGLGMVGLFGWHYRSRSQVSPVNLAV